MKRPMPLLNFPLTREEVRMVVTAVAIRAGRNPNLFTEEQMQQSMAGLVQCLTLLMELGWKIEPPLVRPPTAVPLKG